MPYAHYTRQGLAVHCEWGQQWYLCDISALLLNKSPEISYKVVLLPSYYESKSLENVWIRCVTAISRPNSIIIEGMKANIPSKILWNYVNLINSIIFKDWKTWRQNLNQLERLSRWTHNNWKAWVSYERAYPTSELLNNQLANITNSSQNCKMSTDMNMIWCVFI